MHAVRAVVPAGEEVQGDVVEEDIHASRQVSLSFF
jgi:hypothetical protein